MKNTLLRLIHHQLRRRRPPTLPLEEARAVLVLQYQMPLGCCVHGTPIYAALKTARPDLKVVVATRGLGLAVLQHDPHIDLLIDTADPMASLGAKLKVAEHIRGVLQEQGIAPDLILQDASNRAGSFALLAALLRLAPTAGFANAPALYDIHLAYDETLSMIDNNLRLPVLLGAPQQHIEPAVYFTEADLDYARRLVRQNEVDFSFSGLAAFVVQGSGGQRTGWHDDRFAEVVEYTERIGYSVFFLGTAADAPAIERVRALNEYRKGISLAGRTTVPQLAALLCLCDLLVSVDTGTMHIGRAAGLPMVVLGPSWQKPLEWLPLGKPNVTVLRGEDRDSVPPDYRLDEIALVDVCRAVRGMQALYSQWPEDRQRRIARLLSTTRA